MTVHPRNVLVPPDNDIIADQIKYAHELAEESRRAWANVIELDAAYERIDELSGVLTHVRDYLIQFYPHSDAAHHCLDAIDQALEAHRVQA